MIGGIEVIKNMYDGINLYRKNFPDESRQILDPLTTMIKLAILGYKPIGTKLAIDNNKIYFQEPTFSQGLLRWVYGNKRYELHQLLHPIGKAVKRYDIKDNSILIIFQLAVKGLNQLKLSYKNNSSLVIHSLELYISIINSVLIIDNDDNRSKSNMILNTISEEDDKIENPFIFSNLWLSEEINLVSKMLKQIETSKKDTNTYLDAVNTILTMKEDRANELILEVTNNL